MVYIYKKNIGGKDNYYLRVSVRKKDRILSKDIAYLGSKIEEVREKLSKLSDYKQEIRKSYKVLEKFINSEHYLEKAKSLKPKTNPYFSYETLLNLDAVKLHYSSEFLKKNYRTKLEIYNEFIIDYVYNSNSLEGNTIGLGETAKLLKEDIAPKNKTSREINDMKNSQKVFNMILETKEELNEDFIIKMHDELLDNIDARLGYRHDEIRVIGAGFKSTPYPYINTDIKILLDWYNKNKNLHPLVLGTIFHHKFETIHPFYDGNGRTGRMIMNYILLKNDFPPIIIRKKTRDQYLEALKKADKAGLTQSEPQYYKELMDYISGELILNYWNNFI
ncbi:MAG: Fic family protein [Candidatus Nanoarchaeia archaeon]|jgi:Fic family protein